MATTIGPLRPPCCFNWRTSCWACWIVASGPSVFAGVGHGLPSRPCVVALRRDIEVGLGLRGTADSRRKRPRGHDRSRNEQDSHKRRATRSAPRDSLMHFSLLDATGSPTTAAGGRPRYSRPKPVRNARRGTGQRWQDNYGVREGRAVLAGGPRSARSSATLLPITPWRLVVNAVSPLSACDAFHAGNGQSIIGQSNASRDRPK